MNNRNTNNKKRKVEQQEQQLEEEEQSQYQNNNDNNDNNDNNNNQEEQIVQPQERKVLSSKEYAAEKNKQIRELKKNVLMHMGRWETEIQGKATHEINSFEKKDGTFLQKLDAQVILKLFIVKDPSSSSTKMGTASSFIEVGKNISEWHIKTTTNKAMDEAIVEALKDLWEIRSIELEIEQERQQQVKPLQPSNNNNL